MADLVTAFVEQVQGLYPFDLFFYFLVFPDTKGFFRFPLSFLLNVF